MSNLFSLYSNRKWLQIYWALGKILRKQMPLLSFENLSAKWYRWLGGWRAVPPIASDLVGCFQFPEKSLNQTKTLNRASLLIYGHTNWQPHGKPSNTDHLVKVRLRSFRPFVYLEISIILIVISRYWFYFCYTEWYTKCNFIYSLS